MLRLVAARRPCWGAALALCLLAALSMFGCRRGAENQFSVRRFPVTPGTALAFDLDQPSGLSVGLLLKVPEPATPQFVVLPFGGTAFVGDPTLLTTFASYGDYSIIGYVPHAATKEVHAVALSPSTPPTVAESDFRRTDLPQNLYILKSGEVKRRFMYRPAVDISALNSALSSVPSEHPRYVTVRLPSGSDVLEHQASVVGTLADIGGAPVKTFKTEDVRRYATKQIDIFYQVPPSAEQRLIAGQAVKLFGVLLIPIIQATLVTSAKVQLKKLRRAIIVVGAVLEIGLIAALLWWAFSLRGTFGLQAGLEITVALIGAAATASILFLKSKE